MKARPILPIGGSAEDALRESNERCRKLIETANDAIFIADAKTGILVDCNKRAGELLGIPRENVIGMHQSELHPPETRARYRKIFKEHVRDGKGATAEAVVVRADGSRIWVDISASVYEADSKKFIQGIFRDITERKQAEYKLAQLNKELLVSNRRLKQLCLRDTCTGLYNHRYLTEIIEAEFYRSRRHAHPLSVIMLDIDYFRSVNDLYGHKFGDLVLRQFARQLKMLVRRYDIVVRFGGEEFVIISPGIERARALVLAKRLLEALELYNFGDKKHVIKLKLSIAAASYPEDSVASGMGLIELVDRILNKIKQDGGNKAYSSMDIKKKKLSVERREERADIKVLKDKIEDLLKKGNQNIIESIFALARAIELKDHYTGEHVESTVHYATKIAMMLNLPEDETENIRQASVLHDLGKIGISDKILHKRSKLTKEEYEEIKRHPQIAADIIRPIHFLHDIIPLILYHHERWDGRGYPIGLKREEIPVGARVIAIADVYQALISDRPYRKAFPKADALKIIRKGSGTQFDPKIVSVFLKILEKEK